MPCAPGPVAEVRQGVLAAEVVGDPVVVERVGRGDRVGVAAPALDRLGRLRPLPQPDQPQPGDPAPGDRGRAPRRGPRRGSGSRGRSAATAGRARRRCSWPAGRARGIQSRSSENRSASTSAPTNDGASPPPAAAAAATAEPEVEAVLLLGQDADRDVEPVERARRAPSRGASPSAPGRSGAGRPASRATGGPAPAAARAAIRPAPAPAPSSRRRRPGGARGRRSWPSGSRPAGRDRRRARGAAPRPGCRWRGGRGRVLEAGRRGLLDAGKRLRERAEKRVRPRVRADRRADARQGAPTSAAAGWRRAASTIARWAASWSRLEGEAARRRSGWRGPARPVDVEPRPTSRRATAGRSGRGRPSAASSGERAGARLAERAGLPRMRLELGTSGPRRCARPSAAAGDRRDGRRAGTAGGDRLASGASAATCSIERRRSSRPGRIELVRPLPDPLGPVEALVDPVGDRLARQQDDVGRPVDQLEVWRSSSIVAETSSTPVVPDRASVSAMFSAPRSEAQTSPTREPG